jgi:hypothetical protein
LTFQKPPTAKKNANVGGKHIEQLHIRMRTIKAIGMMIILVGCSTAREDIVLEAFTEPFVDWYSLKLYSNGEFDLHIPSRDYRGTFEVSGDTVFLKSVENEKRPMMHDTRTRGVKDQRWTFIVDTKARKIRTIHSNDSSAIVIDIVDYKL